MILVPLFCTNLKLLSGVRAHVDNCVIILCTNAQGAGVMMHDDAIHPFNTSKMNKSQTSFNDANKREEQQPQVACESAVTNSDIDPIRRSSINAALINDDDDEVQTVYESLNFPNQPKRHPCFSNFRAAAGSEHGLDSLVAQGVVVDVDRH